MEHFGPKIELLDINTDGENVVNFACFTEKQYVKTEGELIEPMQSICFTGLTFLNRLFEQAAAYLYCRRNGRV